MAGCTNLSAINIGTPGCDIKRDLKREVSFSDLKLTSVTLMTAPAFFESTLRKETKMLNTKDYNAMSLAQPTNFKAMLNSGQFLWGTGCRIPHPEAARIIAATPFHFCFLDAEHAPLNATLLVSLVRTIQYQSNGCMVPFVRIPRCSPELYNYVLGAGAGGVVMPHIQNAKQAEELVRLCRFPPMGDRSFPPAALIGEQQNRTPIGQSTYDVWDSHVAVFCQIEDLEGLENVEEICKVPGVDGLFIGTGDLRMCMKLSHGSLDGDEPVYLAALKKIRDAAKVNNLPIMGFGISPAALQLRIDMGWNAFIIHGDIDAICTSATDSLQTYTNAAYGRNGHQDGGKNGDSLVSGTRSLDDVACRLSNVTMTAKSSMQPRSHQSP